MRPSLTPLSLKPTLALIGLWPLLLTQAIYTHRVTPRLPEPEGARAGQIKRVDQPVLRLLIAGDSAAAGVGVTDQAQALSGRLVSILADDFALQWQLLAQSGDTTRDLIARLEQTPAQTIDVAVLSLGANDVLSARRCRTWIAQQQALIELLHTRFEVRHIIFTAVPPLHEFPALPQPLRWFLGLRAEQFTRALAELLARRYPQHPLFQMNFIAGEGVLAADGFHPGWGTYLFWGHEVAQIIKRLYPPERKD